MCATAAPKGQGGSWIKVYLCVFSKVCCTLVSPKFDSPACMYIYSSGAYCTIPKPAGIPSAPRHSDRICVTLRQQVLYSRRSLLASYTSHPPWLTALVVAILQLFMVSTLQSDQFTITIIINQVDICDCTDSRTQHPVNVICMHACVAVNRISCPQSCSITARCINA